MNRGGAHPGRWLDHSSTVVLGGPRGDRASVGPRNVPWALEAISLGILLLGLSVVLWPLLHGELPFATDTEAFYGRLRKATNW